MSRLDNFTPSASARKVSRPASARTTRPPGSLANVRFAGFLRHGACATSPAPRPPGASGVFQELKQSLGPSTRGSPRDRSTASICCQSYQSSDTKIPAAFSTAGMSTDKIYNADLHRKVQHVPCAREVQLALRQRLLDLESRSKIRSLSREGLQRSAQPTGSTVTACAASDAPFTQRADADSGGDEDSDAEDYSGAKAVPALQLSAVGATSPAPGAGPSLRTVPDAPRPASARPATTASTRRDAVLEKPRFSTDFRIDSSWSPAAYSIPEYFESEVYLKVISSRASHQRTSSSAAVVAAASLSDAQRSIAVAPAPPAVPVLPCRFERHSAPVFSHEDRQTADAKEAQRNGRHLKPFIVPFPLEKSLRQPDTCAALFIHEQEEARTFRDMMRFGLRPPVPTSVANELFAPHQKQKDSQDFVLQDDQYFQTIRKKISTAVTASLSKKQSVGVDNSIRAGHATVQ
jgi:hypothetical protein